LEFNADEDANLVELQLQQKKQNRGRTFEVEEIEAL
jgi:hypothetical protein